MKERIAISIESALIEQMRIQAVKEKRTLSEIAADLFREYLKKSKK